MSKCSKSYISLLLSFLMIISLAVFAAELGILKVEAEEIIYGDVSGDGIVNSTDYTMMRRYQLKIIASFPVLNWQTVADVKPDGKIDSTDYTILRRYILGIIDSLPYGESSVTPAPTVILPTTTPPTSTPTVLQGDLFVAPYGEDGNPGTLDKPTTLESAITRITPGNTIYMLGGTYEYSTEIVIERTNSGVSGKMKSIFAYGSQKPVLDFSSQPYISNDVNQKGIRLVGSYWHIKGLEITGSADNGMYLCGHYNLIEQCVFHHNRDTGLQISRHSEQDTYKDWPSYNLVLNCDSFENDDPDNHEDADGFACKLTSGDGNVFRGCIAYHNNDDGWDLYTKPATGPIGEVLIENCIAYENGYRSNGSGGISSTPGDGNGFKLGGSEMPVDHTIRYSIAFKNRVKGIHYNSNSGSILVENCTSWDNHGGGNFVFLRGNHIFKNNLSFYNVGKKDEISGTDVEGSNCWWNHNIGSISAKGLVVSEDDFISLAPTISRNADGSINLGNFLKLSSNSDLIDAGTPQGTDIGAVESN
ncbi:MAG: right-handed parallel beta-helix repeat-containing protein [Bacillota bacterium]